jgi:hypothetical protein
MWRQEGRGVAGREGKGGGVGGGAPKGKAGEGGRARGQTAGGREQRRQVIASPTVPHGQRHSGRQAPRACLAVRSGSGFFRSGAIGPSAAQTGAASDWMWKGRPLRWDADCLDRSRPPPPHHRQTDEASGRCAHGLVSVVGLSPSAGNSELPPLASCSRTLSECREVPGEVRQGQGSPHSRAAGTAAQGSTNPCVPGSPEA